MVNFLMEDSTIPEARRFFIMTTCARWEMLLLYTCKLSLLPLYSCICFKYSFPLFWSSGKLPLKDNNLVESTSIHCLITRTVTCHILVTPLFIEKDLELHVMFKVINFVQLEKELHGEHNERHKMRIAVIHVETWRKWNTVLKHRCISRTRRYAL